MSCPRLPWQTIRILRFLPMKAETTVRIVYIILFWIFKWQQHQQKLNKNNNKPFFCFSIKKWSYWVTFSILNLKFLHINHACFSYTYMHRQTFEHGNTWTRILTSIHPYVHKILFQSKPNKRLLLDFPLLYGMKFSEISGKYFHMLDTYICIYSYTK